MTINDVMKYIESEFLVINDSHCEICGGEFLTQEMEMDFIDGVPYDICDCVCSNCGYEKVFEFFAPFVEDKDLKKIRHKLN